MAQNSLTQYRGHTVGFCNPDCSDKFATAREQFDQLLKADPPISQNTPIPVYKPRFMKPDSIWVVGDIHLKSYTITPDEASEISARNLEKAKTYVDQTLPKAVLENGGHHNLGFAIIHQGNEDIWLLIHWWGGGDICLSTMARMEQSKGMFKSVAHTGLHACVWEQVVITHESRAWIRTMMTGQPDPSHYLTDTLPADFY